MKHEPGLGSYGDELVRDRGSPGERLEERGGDPAASPGGPPLGLVPPPRYPGSLDGPGTGADGDDYKSSSESPLLIFGFKHTRFVPKLPASVATSVLLSKLNNWWTC